MNNHKIQNILSLDSKDRYDYLIRKVADFEQIFLIGDEKDTYVTLGNGDVECIPVWPEFGFAQLFLKMDWEKYTIKMVELDKFLPWLDQLDKEGYQIAGFPNMDYNATIVRPSEMKKHLLSECEQYE